MKKLLLIAAVLISASSFAQRSIDWTTSEILTPDSLQSASAGTQINLSFVGKNLGTDTVFPGDSIWYQYVVTIGSNLVVRYPNINNAGAFAFVAVNDTIAPNDSVIVNAPVITAGVNVNTSLLATVGVISHIVNRPSANFETGSGLTNNSRSVSVTWWNQQRFPVGLSDELNNVSATVYPNPVSDKLYFETNTNTAKNITVMDITGKVVATISTSEEKAELDVTTFNKGLYFYDIKTTTGEVLKSGKFNVQ